VADGPSFVSRDVVLSVLRAHGVECYPSELDSNVIVLTKGELYEAQALPEAIGRRMLDRFKRKFDVPIHHFFNPHLAIPDNVTQIAARRKPASGEK
jgi:hypothetical protein